MPSELVHLTPASVALYHRNPRVGDVKIIRDSLRAHGQYKPIVVNKGTHTGRPMEVLAGNHTVKAFRDLLEAEPGEDRWQRMAAYVIDVDEDEAARIVLVDNRSAQLGGFDNEALTGLLEGLPGLDGTGYTEDDLAALLDGLDPTADLDDGPALPRATGEAGALARQFGVPPFTIIDTRQGAWRERVAAWKAVGVGDPAAGQPAGRAGELTYDNGLAYANWWDVKELARQENPGQVLTDAQITERYGHLLKPFNGGTSVFDPALAELLIAWFSTPGDDIVDPWAGGSVRGIVAARMGRNYEGVELREEQVEANLLDAELAVPGTAAWHRGDCLEVLPTMRAEAYDMVLACPPYFDLETYSEDPADMSNLSTDDFRAAMVRTVALVAERLREDRYAVFVVGAVRDAKGYLRDMKSMMIEAADRAGLRYINDAVLVGAVGSAAVRAARPFSTTRTITRTHQDIVVFVKGDRKAAAARLGDIPVFGLDEVATEEIA